MMNSKNTLIERLLKVAKRHKILTYPVLALVAIISVINYFFSWSHGAGKRVVAVVMVMLMLVSQSYFLTSSATALVDDENAARVQKQLQGKALVDAPMEFSEEDVAVGDTEEQQDGTPSSETTTSSSQDNTSSQDTQSSQDSVAGGDTSGKDISTVTTTTGTDGAESGSADTDMEQEKTTQVEGEVGDEQPVGEGETPTQPEPVTKDLTMYFYYPEGGPQLLLKPTVKMTQQPDSGDYTGDLTPVFENVKKAQENPQKTQNGCYQLLDKWYRDAEFKDEFTERTTLTLSKEFMEESANPQLLLYCDKELVNYQVTITNKTDDFEDDISYKVEGTGIVTGENVYYIPATGAQDAKSGSFNLNEIKRTGYTIQNVKAPYGDSAPLTGNNAVVTLNGNAYKKDLTLEWKANTYQIEYACDEVGTVLDDCTQTVVYDSDTEKIWNPDGIVQEKAGYKFKNWRINSVTGKEVEPGNNVALYQKDLYNQTAKLFPNYEYQGIVVDAEKDGIRYTYKGKDNIVSRTIMGRYKDSNTQGSPSFTYEITSNTNDLKTKGLLVTLDPSGGIKIEIAPTGLTGSKSDGFDLKFKIKDSNLPADPDATDSFANAPEFTVKIYIDQCNVEIDASGVKTEKVYDGDDKVTFDNREFPTNVSGVKVTFKSCNYNSSDVATATRIDLVEPEIVVSGNDSPNDYLLKNNYIPGKITPRKVFLKTFALYPNDKGYIRTGEKNPAFDVELDEESNDSSTGFLNGYTLEDLKKKIIYSVPDREEGGMTTGKFDIHASVEAKENYQVMVYNKGKLTVIQEDPTESVNYSVIGEKNGNWYISNPTQLIPKNDNGYIDYDTVRISKNAGTVDDSGALVNLTEKNYEYGTDLYVQLYNSDTGAVTSWKKLEFDIDHTAPDYVSFNVTQDNETVYDSSPDGLYFPTKGMVTFGSYFNRVVNVNIKYKDEISGAAKLQYGLYGEDAGTRYALFSKADTEGYQTAQFELLEGVADKIGVINYYAEDAAGNKGQNYTLQRDGASEWSVEASGPRVDNYYIKAGEKQLESVVSGSKDYYSNCTAYVEVSDDISGIYSIVWNVNGVAYEEERIENTGSRQNKWTFNKNINNTNFPSDNGEYKVFATITDNAQNTEVTKTIELKVDDVVPEINITSDYDKWVPSVKIDFDTSDDLSGIKYINVTDEDGNILDHHVEKVEDGVSYCYFETTKKGTYHIIVSDKAGNVNEKTLVLNKVSSEKPDCPTVVITPDDALDESGWYNKMPSAVITNVTKTSDETLVDTNYQLWQEGETSYNVTTLPKEAEDVSVDMPGEGIYNLKVWSESKTGQICDDEHVYQLKVDTVAPTIEFATTKGTGATILVNYTVIDGGSGVDKDSIKVLHGTRPIATKVEETDNGFKGSFEISETGNYAIHAEDIAGNISDAAAFSPMSMRIKAVTNISSTGATVGANVIKGTFDVKSVALSYRKYADTEYKEVDAVVTKDEVGNVNLSSALAGLEAGTAYAYKVVATSEEDEVLVYEGYFKTLSDNGQGISIAGKARYADDSEGTITVGLFEGKICVMAKEINAGEEFTFSQVSDGNYNVVATDGIYTKSVRLLVKDGTVIYPDEYIDLVLSGKNTSVEITTDETPDITADNMDSIFEDDNVNFTDEDKEIIAAGGTVEFKLYATLMKVTSVSAKELAAMYAVTDKDKVVGAFLDLSLYKIITDVDGNTAKNRVTKLASGANISVTIPLGELTGKPELEVVRIHNEGENFFGSSLMDQDTNPSTYTVTTNQFSTYAVLYSVEEPTTEPTTEPTEEPTEEPTTAVTEEPSTEQPDAEQPTTEGKKKPSKKPGKDKDKTTDKKTSSSSVGSLKSSGSAKTGDETPIAVLGSMMLLSVGGLIILRKKSKKIQ